MSLWADTIRLAYHKSETRGLLLPLLKQAAGWESSIFSSLTETARRSDQPNGWDQYLVFPRSVVKLDASNAGDLRSLLQRKFLGVVSKPKREKRGWYVRYHGHRPKEDLFLSHRDASTKEDVVGDNFASLESAVKALRTYHHKGEWSPDMSGILAVLDAGMEFSHRKDRRIAVRALLGSVSNFGELTFSMDGTLKPNIQAMKNIQKETRAFLEKRFPARSFGFRKMSYFYDYTGKYAEGIRGVLQIGLTEEEYSLRDSLKKEMKTLNEKYLEPLRQEKREEAAAREEKSRQQAEQRVQQEKEEAARWRQSLSPADRQLYDNLVLLRETAEKKNNTWLSQFSESVLEQFKSRGRLSPKQIAVVNRNLDQMGVSREVSREETTVMRQQRKLNQPLIDRIKALPNYQDKEFLLSLLRQLELGQTLSPKQMDALDRAAPPLVGSKESLRADFNSLNDALRKKVIPALAKAWRDIYAEEGMLKESKEASKDILDAFAVWAGGGAYTWSWANAQLSQTLLGTVLGISAPDSDWLFQLRDQVERTTGAKTPTKKAKLYIADMRRLLSALQGQSKKSLAEAFHAHIK